MQNTSEIAYFKEDRSNYLDQFELCINDMNNQKYINFSRKLPELLQCIGRNSAGVIKLSELPRYSLITRNSPDYPEIHQITPKFTILPRKQVSDELINIKV